MRKKTNNLLDAIGPFRSIYDRRSGKKGLAQIRRNYY